MPHSSFLPPFTGSAGFIATATWRRLDQSSTEPSVPAPAAATLGGCQGRRLLMRSEVSAPSGAPVRLDFEGSMFLGEVVASSQIGDKWEVVLEIDQVVPAQPDLVNLMTAVGWSPVRVETAFRAPETHPLPPVETPAHAELRRRKETPSR